MEAMPTIEVDDPVWGMLLQLGRWEATSPPDSADLHAIDEGGPASPASASADADIAQGHPPSRQERRHIVMQQKQSAAEGRNPPPSAPAIDRCPHCVASAAGGGTEDADVDIAGTSVEVREGNLVCRDCCSVLGRQLDYGAEWRFYGAEDPRGSNPTRCCPPSNGLIQTLGSVIAAAPRRRQSQWQNRTEGSAAAAQSSSAAGRSVQRYQVWNSMTYRERVLCGVFDTLSVSAAQHGLPACILEEAKVLYKRVSEARITRGENRKAVIAASIYVACKKNGVPRSLKEVADMFDLRSAALTKACRAFQEVVLDADTDSSAAADFVGRFCSRLGMDADATDRVRDVVRRADEQSLVCDAMPPSIVGGAIAHVSDAFGLGLSKEQIAAVCMVAPITIAKTQKRLGNLL